MDYNDITAHLSEKGVKPTANRILVLRTLQSAETPLSLSELESVIDTMDKSSLFRTLTLFAEHELVHTFEDGRGVLKYELCHSRGHCDHNDAHIHFYCKSCRQTFCMKTLLIPELDLPEGFTASSISYLITGECPNCKNRSHVTQ